MARATVKQLLVGAIVLYTIHLYMVTIRCSQKHMDLIRRNNNTSADTTTSANTSSQTNDGTTIETSLEKDECWTPRPVSTNTCKCYPDSLG